MNIEETLIEGCYLIHPKVFRDTRGTFVKTFQSSIFKDLKMETRFLEDFYSFSNANVIRGMHFQTPPHDHAKLVSCLTGKILDVVVDMRSDSRSFRKYLSIDLDSNDPKLIYIPKGCAHGFLSLEDNSCVTYKVSTEHHAASDSGIRWDSFGFEWPCRNPIVSARDQGFATLDDFFHALT